MGRSIEIKITPELTEKVIRCYTEKNMPVNMIAKLICPRYVTLKILSDAGIPLKTRGQGLRQDKRFDYKTRFPSFDKLS